MKHEYQKERSGFSLVELVVIIAIVAVLAAILVPSLLTYTERSRAQKDVTTMDEVVNAVQLAMSDSDCYDEMILYSCDNNFLTYSDSSGKYGQQVVDSEYWVPDGQGKATTITFNPEKDSEGNTIYRLENAIVNDMTFGNGSVADERQIEGAKIENNQCYLKNAKLTDSMEAGYLYSKIKATVGTDVITTSATYANSSFTIFIKFQQKDGTTVADVSGAFNGTNLDAGSQASLGSNTTEYVDNNFDKPIETTTEGGTQEVNITSSALQGTGSIVPDYKGGSPLIDNAGSTTQDTPFVPMQPGQEYIILDGEYKTSVRLVEDGSIDLLYDGQMQANMPSACITILNDNIFTITAGDEAFDGTYEFFTDGYVEKDGQVIAKAKARWLDIEEGIYIIIHKGDMYASQNGNTLDEFVFSRNDIISSLETINAGLADPSLAQLANYYTYKLSNYNGGAITVKNLFDMYALENIMENFNSFQWTGRYNYWGSAAQDQIVGNKFRTVARWNNDMIGTIDISFISVIPNGEIEMTMSDIIEGKVIKYVKTENYEFRGKKPPAVFFVSDIPFPCEDTNMTNREWIENSSWRCSYLSTIYDYENYYIYFPEFALDEKVGVCGYPGKLIYTYNLTYHRDYADYYEIGLCDGYIEPQWYDISSPLWETNTYKGVWYGEGQPVSKKLLSYEYYYYCESQGVCRGNGDYYSYTVFPAFDLKAQNVVNISEYLIENGNSVSLDTNRIKTELGIVPDLIEKIHRDGDSLVLLQGNTCNLTATGYVFVNNGTVYVATK